MALSMMQSKIAPCKTPVSARRAVVVAAARPMWYPGATAPKHLNGTMAGDYGFDPLRLGTNPESLKWFREAELMNGRWAMAAVTGILFTEIFNLPKWWLAGGETYPIDVKTQLAIGVPIFTILEAKRFEGFKKTGETGFLSFFPFDPLNRRKPEQTVKELKNGRLAMLAFLGFASTAAVNGQGPIESLQAHIADPGHNNIYTSIVGKETLVFISVLCVLPMIIETSKTLSKGKEEEPLFPWNEPWTANK
ncbi:MAG: hypothetical protein WDW38_004681 [Sanguina aurantia]